jgi:TRAP-type C4-dicarboxylate transport system permease small subunit
MNERKKMLPEELAAAAIIILMVLMVTVQVVSRYALHISLSYTEELVRYLFVWATFLGAAGAARMRRHLSVSSGTLLRSVFLLRWVRRFIGACGALFAGMLLLEGARVAVLQMTTSQTTAALGLPMWMIGLSVPVGALLILVRIVQAAAGKGDRR